MKKLKFKAKKQSLESGFSLLEVLVGILLATVFTLIGLQASVIAALVRVKALQVSAANNWIREDLEEVKYQATYYYPVNQEALCKATTAADGFAAKFQVHVGGTIVNGVGTTQKTEFVLNKPFIIKRETRYDYTGAYEPYNTLKVIYTVAPAESPTSVIAYTQSEIIPEASFDCKYL